MKRTSVISLLLYVLVNISLFAQIDIWAGSDCKHRVMMTPYIADRSDGIGIVVCPGGSYFWHDMKSEGEDVCRWLNHQGVSAFLLEYRTAKVPAFITHFRWFVRGNRYPDPQDDLRQALRYIRSHSDSLGVDIDKIGVMGFSAGGHLALTSAMLFDHSDRPSFVAAIYPVVTMNPPFVHKRSRRGLLGDSRTGNTALCDSLSMEKRVTSDCPPVFLLNCKDDPVVDYHNSEMLDSALTVHQVPHYYLQYTSGGHGFGANDTKGTELTRKWKTVFMEWLISQDL